MMDLGLVARSLRGDGWAALDPPEWLVESWRAPAHFVAELAAWHDATAPAPLKSAPASRYDLFHDLVLRRAGSPTAALAWYDGVGRRRELSFMELGWAAGQRAEAWRGAGAQAGQVVAIARPSGRELTISLLAALKLGLIVSIVPPSGRLLARVRLAALSPALVDAEPPFAALAPEGAQLLPCADGRDARLERSHAYAPGEPMALLFDATTPTVPRPLAAEAAWLGALRDGAIALGLRAGDALAAPELPLVGAQPALAFAALASGATFVHLTLDELERAPELLVEQPLAMLGVTPSLRELVRRRRLVLGERCAAWFRDPLASTRLEPWQDFVAGAALQATPAVNLRWEAALGGVALFSPRRIGRAHCEVLPATGAAWSVVELADDAQPVLAGPGRFALTPPAGAPSVTAAIVLPQGRGWMSAGSLPAHPGGRAFPVAEARAAAAAVPGCRAAVVLHDPSAAGDPPRVVLLAFGTVTPAEVYDALELALGPEHLPDDVLCFPLLPRRDDAGLPDERWCHQQLRAGALGRKSRDELHLLLSRLRARVVPIVEESP